MAHVALFSGTLRRGVGMDTLMHALLGRPPGTVPGEADATPPPSASGALSPEASVEYMALWVRGHGGKDRRPGVAGGS